MVDIIAFLERHREWARNTFGPGNRVAGILDHLRKELVEVEASEGRDLEEWADVLLLAFDGPMRAGYSPTEVVEALESKLAKNMTRTWPDWRMADPDKAIEHVR